MERIGRFVGSDGSEEDVFAGDPETEFPTTRQVQVGDGTYQFWPQVNGDVHLYPLKGDGSGDKSGNVGPKRGEIPPQGFDLGVWDDIDRDGRDVYEPVTYIPD